MGAAQTALLRLVGHSEDSKPITSHNTGAIGPMRVAALGQHRAQCAPVTTTNQSSVVMTFNVSTIAARPHVPSDARLAAAFTQQVRVKMRP